ncbi:MAG: 2-hydroxyacyl-CoA dehydratase [Clostridia bacterium]|nr:2-hydroxyacyl-CoA dehydratase [Clostridia bacterium]
MAEKSEDRIIFTKKMKQEYKILLPMMLPIHFNIINKLLLLEGYQTELLDTVGNDIVQEGLKGVHNDTCYPALLVIGQLINAVKSGKYDMNKVALLITQTGGGCRASNYIHLLRKALKHNNLGHIPVISLNLSGLEKNPGFKLKLPLIIKMVYGVAYGDMLMWLSNQTRPYEINKGESDLLVKKWEHLLTEEFINPINLRMNKVVDNLSLIVKEFAEIKLSGEKKKKVGIVGEIYIKYSPLGNNNLEDFLLNENCEVIVPGLMDFLIFKADNRMVDIEIFGGKRIKYKIIKWLEDFFIKMQNQMIKAIKENSSFRTVAQFKTLKSLVKDYVGHGNRMGEGWLLTGEMLELINMGINNIICTQPFSCLPNHIVGKGMIRKIKDNNSDANIVAIDYDPGATKINQENRIKLMLANAEE